MKVAGVITEYNPFHNGHKYQLEEIRSRTGADYIIAVMSGDFVQRGTPAILDKYQRVEMALRNGADMVLELPTLYATSSAEGFARGGVGTLLSTGIITHLCFGAESDQLELLTEIARVLNAEPSIYIEALQMHLKAGEPFPVARSKALCEYFSAECNWPNPAGDNPAGDHSSAGIAQITAVLGQPNNILAIEYLRQLLLADDSYAHAQPVLIPRVGSGYHDTTAINSEGDAVNFASATAIRKMLKDHTDSLGSNKVTFIAADSMYEDEDLDDDALFDAMQARYMGNSNKPEAVGLRKGLMDYVPQDAIIPLIFGSREHQLLFEDSTSQMLAYSLQMLRAAYRRDGVLPRYGDCSEDLMHRILSLVDDFRSTSQFIELVKNKSTTYSHVSRALLQILLQESADLVPAVKDQPGYIRVLGFRKEASALLGLLSEHAKVPVVTRPVDYRVQLDGSSHSSRSASALSCFELDLAASDLYNQMVALQGGNPVKNDFSHPMVIL